MTTTVACRLPPAACAFIALLREGDAALSEELFATKSCAERGGAPSVEQTSYRRRVLGASSELEVSLWPDYDANGHAHMGELLII